MNIRTVLKKTTDAVVKRIEAFMHTDVRYAARGGFWLSAGFTTSSIVTFLLSLVYANLLTKEAFGVYRYINSTVNLLMAFTLTGINTAVTQAVARGFEGTLPRSISLQFKWSLPFMIATLGTGAYYLSHGNTTIGPAFLAASVIVPVGIACNTYIAFLNGKQDFKRIGQYNIASTLIVSLATLAALLFSKNILTLITVNMAASSLVNLFLYFSVIRRYKPQNAPSDEQAFPFAKHLSVLNILTIIAGQVENFFIFHWLGAVELAVFSFAIALPDRLKGFSKIIQYLALPKYAVRSIPELKKGFGMKLFKFTGLLFLFSLCYIALAPFFFRLFFPQYMDAIPLTRLYAFSLIASASNVPMSALLAQRKSKSLSFYNITTSIFQIIAACVLIPLFGLLGAVVSRLGSAFFSLFLSILMLYRTSSNASPALPADEQ